MFVQNEAPAAQIKVPQVTVLDAGGQYCHLIARKIRDLGVFAEVRPSETPASELAGRKGLVQTVYPLSEGAGLALTTFKYYTPSGRQIQRDYSNISFFDY